MRPLRTIVSLLLVCLAGSTASADGVYFTEGIGNTKISDELAAYMPTDALRIRIAVGVRHDRWAVEGFVAATINGEDRYGGGAGQPEPAHPYQPDGGGYRRAPDLTAFGLDVKYINPIARHLELYLRGSIGAAAGDGALQGYTGRGLGFGAGIQLKGKVPALGFLWWPLFLTNLGPKVTGALWLDDGYDFYRLHGPSPTAIDAQLTHLTFGFAFGSDF